MLHVLLAVLPLFLLPAWIVGPATVAQEGLTLLLSALIPWQMALYALFEARRIVALQRALGVFLGGIALVALSIDAALWTRQLSHVPGWLYPLMIAIALPTLLLRVYDSGAALLKR